MSHQRARLSLASPVGGRLIGTLFVDDGNCIAFDDEIPVIVIPVARRAPYLDSDDKGSRVLAKMLVENLRDPEVAIRRAEMLRPMLDENECRELDDAKALIREAVMLREAVQSALDSNDDAATEPLERKKAS